MDSNDRQLVWQQTSSMLHSYWCPSISNSTRSRPWPMFGIHVIGNRMLHNIWKHNLLLMEMFSIRSFRGVCTDKTRMTWDILCLVRKRSRSSYCSVVILSPSPPYKTRAYSTMTRYEYCDDGPSIAQYHFLGRSQSSWSWYASHSFLNRPSTTNWAFTAYGFITRLLHLPRYGSIKIPKAKRSVKVKGKLTQKKSEWRSRPAQGEVRHRLGKAGIFIQ